VDNGFSEEGQDVEDRQLIYTTGVVGAVLLKKHRRLLLDSSCFSSEILLAFTQEDLAIVGVIVLLRLALFS
jgi:hypothetical protein